MYARKARSSADADGPRDALSGRSVSAAATSYNCRRKFNNKSRTVNRSK